MSDPRPVALLRRWWRGPADPVMRLARLLVLVLWPSVFLWALPGMHRPGSGEVMVGVLVVLYSAGALLLLSAGARAERVLPVCLPLFAAAAAAGALSVPRRDIALVIPVFLVVLCAFAAMRLSRAATALQVGVASVAGGVCIAWAAMGPLVSVVTFAAVVAAMAMPAAAIHGLRSQLDASRAREHRLARTDPLTGVLNRRGLFEAAGDLLSSARQVDVVTLDLDGFKQLNDTHGHAAGDEALRAVAAQLTSLTAGGDLGAALVARWGGEEFLVLAQAGELSLAAVAEAIRAAAGVTAAAGWRTSASVGAVRDTPPDLAEDRSAWLLRRVDAADGLMYRAKRSGGDRVLAQVA